MIRDARAFLESTRRFEMMRAACLAVLKQLPDESIDHFVTDPPYGIGLKLHWNRKRPLSIRGDGHAEAIKLWREWIPQAARLAKPNTLHVVFATWKSPWMHRLLSRHFRVVGCVVWDKRQITLGYHLRPRWEQFFLIAKGKPQRLGTAPADVWQCPRINHPLHPCQKPTELLARAIELVSRPGEIICDPFAGIASTGVAAMQTGRRFLGMEIDARHAKLGRKRLELATK